MSIDRILNLPVIASLAFLMSMQPAFAEDDGKEETIREYKAVTFSDTGSRKIVLQGCKGYAEVSNPEVHFEGKVWLEAKPYEIADIPEPPENKIASLNDDDSVESTTYLISCIKEAMGEVQDGESIVKSSDLKPVRFVFTYNYNYYGSKKEVVYDCYWDQDNRKIDSVDKPYTGSFNYLGEDVADQDTQDFYTFKRPIEMADENNPEPNAPKNYCVEVRTKYRDNMYLAMTCYVDDGEKERKICTNLVCNGEGSNEEYIVRNYVNDVPLGKDLRIELSFGNSSSLEPLSAAYEIEVRTVQPVIFIHDLGDGPDGYEKSQSEWSYQLREDMPYICKFKPNQTHEFSWIATQKNSFLLYAGEDDTQLSFYVKSISKNYTKKPVVIAQGVGGLIFTGQLQKDAKFLDGIKHVFFCGTPFFGTEIGTVVNGAACIDEKSRLKSAENLPVLLSFPSVAAPYGGYICSRINDGLLGELGRGSEFSWKRREKYAKLPLNNAKVTFFCFSSSKDYTGEYIKQSRSAVKNGITKFFPYVRYVLDNFNVALSLNKSTASLQFLTVPIPYLLDYIDKKEEDTKEKLAEALSIQLNLFGDGVVSVATADIAGFYGWSMANNVIMEDRKFYHVTMLWLFDNGQFVKDRREISEAFLKAINK